MLQKKKIKWDGDKNKDLQSGHPEKQKYIFLLIFWWSDVHETLDCNFLLTFFTILFDSPTAFNVSVQVAAENDVESVAGSDVRTFGTLSRKEWSRLQLQC